MFCWVQWISSWKCYDQVRVDLENEIKAVSLHSMCYYLPLGLLVSFHSILASGIQTCRTEAAS